MRGIAVLEDPYYGDSREGQLSSNIARFTTMEIVVLAYSGELHGLVVGGIARTEAVGALIAGCRGASPNAAIWAWRRRRWGWWGRRGLLVGHVGLPRFASRASHTLP